VSDQELIRNAYEVWNIRDYDAIWELLDPEIEIDASSHALNPYVRHGHEGFRQMVEEVADAWDQWRLEPEEFIERGDRLVVAARVRARGRGSGVELDQVVYNVWMLRHGKVTRLAFYADRDQALRDSAKEQVES
jgi:ketosteroid isomerase-like protein